MLFWHTVSCSWKVGLMESKHWRIDTEYTFNNCETKMYSAVAEVTKNKLLGMPITAIKSTHLHLSWQSLLGNLFNKGSRCLTDEAKHGLTPCGKSVLNIESKYSSPIETNISDMSICCDIFKINHSRNSIGYENLFSPQLTFCWSLRKKNTKTWERENRTGQEASRCVVFFPFFHPEEFKSLFLHNIRKQIWLQF